MEGTMNCDHELKPIRIGPKGKFISSTSSPAGQGGETMEKKTMTPIVVLRTFFGQKEGQTLKGFMEEIKELSEQEKLHLAKLAAEELGVELEQLHSRWSRNS